MREGTNWRRRHRAARIEVRITTYQKKRWKKAAPRGNISAWLRALADIECNSLPGDRRVTDFRP